eukprot:CAMPEP_0118633188 /NCGR_PEP_ID=MMETSP0785-20121206/858_1 /TAXON_ID=91992 /ORGANISM="Bolidomonas pacifica, Strain CCMP 1866" /LENGTH=122 /DNA_ID=CAMNT_0006524035 /DNA_START=647 /DNA_END=1013 /DNA_ORIENTATION=-
MAQTKVINIKLGLSPDEIFDGWASELVEIGDDDGGEYMNEYNVRFVAPNGEEFNSVVEVLKELGIEDFRDYNNRGEGRRGREGFNSVVEVLKELGIEDFRDYNNRGEGRRGREGFNSVVEVL